MKTLYIIRLITTLNLILAITAGVIAQPDYSFRNPVLISGVDKKPGAKYKFTNVRPNIDALLTVVQNTGGVTLNQLDGTGNGGFSDAFQPVLNTPRYTNGFVEFKVDFVNGGTTTPRILTEIPLTCIDVDGKNYGNGMAYEFDQVKCAPGAGYMDYQMIGTEMSVTYGNGWITGRNKDGIEYPGIDTVVKRVMFGAVIANTSTITFRVGTDNQSNTSDVRLRSVYFKKFIYQSSYLPTAPLINFKGVSRNKKIELQWQLTNDNIIKSIVVERGKTASQFSPINEVSVKGEENLAKVMHQYTDNYYSDNNTFYRLKLISTNGKILYSNVLAFRPETGSQQPFRVYPSNIDNSTTISVKAYKVGNGLFQLVDYSGRVIHQQNVNFHDGDNNIQLSNLGAVNRGNYVAVLNIQGQLFNQKVSKN